MIIYTSRNNQTMQTADLTGQRFGRLSILSYSGRSKHKQPDHLWLCECDCGTVRPVLLRSLKRGLALSCGCIRAEKQKLRGPEHPHYRGGKSHDTNGYITLTSKIHGRNHQAREHRVMMEEHIGRKLTPNEVVHHKNENKSDNRIENLQVMTRAEHTSYHRRKNSNNN